MLNDSVLLMDMGKPEEALPVIARVLAIARERLAQLRMDRIPPLHHDAA